MKLLQWNIWYQEDINNILKVVRELNPDIVCLQEVTIGNPGFNRGIDTPVYLAEGLGYYHYYKEALDDPNNTLGCAIYSRFPITKKSFTFVREQK